MEQWPLRVALSQPRSGSCSRPSAMYHVPVTDQTMLGLGNKCGTSHRKAVGSKLERRAQVRLECSLCLSDRKMKLKIQQQVMSQVTSSSQPSNAAMGLAGVAETQRGVVPTTLSGPRAWRHLCGSPSDRGAHGSFHWSSITAKGSLTK